MYDDLSACTSSGLQDLAADTHRAAYLVHFAFEIPADRSLINRQPWAKFGEPI